jgi:hypothetical protein
MTKKRFITSITLVAALFCGSAVFAQAPVVNIDPHRHGNLAAAQKFIVQAYQRIDQAQRANEDQLGGHAQRAKDYLTQADAELRLAANVANEEGHR